MKAIVLTAYGDRDVLDLRELPKPAPGPDEALVRVHASTVNDWDWAYLRGRPYLQRLIMGIRRPNVRILGAEVAGTVEAVGSDVTTFQVGDAVYGDISEAGFGGFAEYACIHEPALTAKPKEMTFAQAAAIPHAFALAWQGMVDLGRLARGMRVLINGAGGGVGTFGVQIARSLGAEATGVDSAVKLDTMRKLGYARVIDYQEQDFTRLGDQYDLVFDAKTTRPPRSYRRALAPGGRYVTVGGDLGRLAQVALRGALSARLGGPQMHVLALKTNHGLEHAHDMFAKGELQVVIDGPYPLSEVPTAMQRFGTARHVGKVVIDVSGSALRW